MIHDSIHCDFWSSIVTVTRDSWLWFTSITVLLHRLPSSCPPSSWFQSHLQLFLRLHASPQMTSICMLPICWCAMRMQSDLRSCDLLEMTTWLLLKKARGSEGFAHCHGIAHPKWQNLPGDQSWFGWRRWQIYDSSYLGTTTRWSSSGCSHGWWGRCTKKSKLMMGKLMMGMKLGMMRNMRTRTRRWMRWMIKCHLLAAVLPPFQFSKTVWSLNWPRFQLAGDGSLRLSNIFQHLLPFCEQSDRDWDNDREKEQRNWTVSELWNFVW